LPVTGTGDMSYLKSDFTLIAEGQTWNMATVAGRLLTGRDDGMSDDKLSPISNNTGVLDIQAFKRQGRKRASSRR
jgi:hypothetical protein